MIIKQLSRFFLLLYLPSTLSASTLVDNRDGTITDKKTGLTWQKCNYGQSYNQTCIGKTEKTNWLTAAVVYCKTLNLAGKSWRLPSIDELKTLVMQNNHPKAAIDTNYFPQTVPDIYWSISTYVPDVDYAWRIDFSNGNTYISNKNFLNYVRCVTDELNK